MTPRLGLHVLSPSEFNSGISQNSYNISSVFILFLVVKNDNISSSCPDHYCRQDGSGFLQLIDYYSFFCCFEWVSNVRIHRLMPNVGWDWNPIFLNIEVEVFHAHVVGQFAWYFFLRETVKWITFTNANNRRLLAMGNKNFNCDSLSLHLREITTKKKAESYERMSWHIVRN